MRLRNIELRNVQRSGQIPLNFDKVFLFETECGHDNQNSERVHGLSSDVKTFINGKFDDGITKTIKQICYSEPYYSKQHLEKPKKSQLTSHL